MKVLTVKQPAASLILLGIKSIENRTWQSPYTGRIAIHASKNNDPEIWRLMREQCEANGVPFPDIEFPYGSLLGTVGLYGAIYENVDGEIDGYGNFSAEMLRWWQRDFYGWVLKKPIPAPAPIPWQGALGLWKIPKDTADLLIPQPAPTA